MSNYTTTIKELLRTNFNLGMTAYPIFNETYRETLNNKILAHYMYREIGFETASRFSYELNIKLMEIMPYYNKLYNSELLIIEPLLDFRETLNDVTKTELESQRDVDENNTQNISDDLTSDEITNTNNISDEVINVNNTSIAIDTFASDNNSNSIDIVNGKNTSNKFQKYEDTPHGVVMQSQYATNLTSEDIDNKTENENILNANSKSKNDSNSNTESESDSNTTFESDTDSNTTFESNRSIDTILDKIVNDDLQSITDFTRDMTREGFTQSQSELLLKFRQTFLNIDMLIINDLNELFMGIY